jgi:hypothetical protein
MDITDASITELQKEIDNRIKGKPIKPAPLVHPNFDVLRKEVNDYLSWLSSDDYQEDDHRKWDDSIAEAAINSFHDNSIWQYFIVPMMEWQGNKGTSRPGDKS